MNTLINEQSLSASADLAENTFNELPRQVTNRVTGDQMNLIDSPKNGSDSLTIEFTLPPRAKGAPLHYHLNFAETFAVTAGSLEMRIGDENRIVASGEAVTVPIGVPHSFGNPRQDSVIFTTEIAPAVEFEKFIRGMYGLANDGKTNKDGMPTNFLHLALLLDYADLYFPFVPSVLQKLARKTLTRLARATGAEKDLSKYFIV